MTVEATPMVLQAGSHSAEIFRRAYSTLLGDRQGILEKDGFVVTEKSGTPNMSVDVAGGLMALQGDESTYQGHYLIENRAAHNVVIASSDPTNPRKDLIIVRVVDSVYSGGSDVATIEVVTGTPAGSPADPSLPSGSVFVLARVDVPASDTAITNSQITDLRRTYDSSQYGYLTAAGGTIICTSSTRPPSPHEGMQIYETDTDKLQFYTGASWSEYSRAPVENTFTPTLTQSGGSPSKTVNYARYHRNSKRITGEVHVTLTGSGSGSAVVIVGLPVAAVAFTGTPVIGNIWVYDSNISTAYQGSLLLVSTTTAVGWADGRTGNIGATDGPLFTLNPNDQVAYNFSYQAAS